MHWLQHWRNKRKRQQPLLWPGRSFLKRNGALSSMPTSACSDVTVITEPFWETYFNTKIWCALSSDVWAMKKSRLMESFYPRWCRDEAERNEPVGQWRSLIHILYRFYYAEATWQIPGGPLVLVLCTTEQLWLNETPPPTLDPDFFQCIHEDHAGWWQSVGNGND